MQGGPQFLRKFLFQALQTSPKHYIPSVSKLSSLIIFSSLAIGFSETAIALEQEETPRAVPAEAVTQAVATQNISNHPSETIPPDSDQSSASDMSIEDLLSHWQHTLNHAQQEGDRIGTIRASLALGQIFLSQGRSEQAIAFYAQGWHELQTVNGQETPKTDDDNPSKTVQDTPLEQPKIEPNETRDSVLVAQDIAHDLSRLESLHHLVRTYLLMEDYSNAYLAYQSIMDIVSQTQGMSPHEVISEFSHVSQFAIILEVSQPIEYENHLLSQDLNQSVLDEQALENPQVHQSPTEKLEQDTTTSALAGEEVEEQTSTYQRVPNSKQAILQKDIRETLEQLKQNTDEPTNESEVTRQGGEPDCDAMEVGSGRESCFQVQLTAATNAWTIAQKSGNRAAQATASFEMGVAYLGLENYEDAIARLQFSAPIFAEVNDLTGHANTFIHIGHVYILQDQFDDAILSYQQALTIAQESESQLDQEVDILVHLTGAYRLNRPLVAERNLEQALNQELVLLLNLAHKAYFIEEVDETVMAYEQAIEVYQALDKISIATGENYSVAEAGLRLDLGDVHLGENDYGSARDTLKQAAALYRTLPGYEQDYVVAILKLGDAYLGMEDYDSALTISKQALDKIEDLEDDFEDIQDLPEEERPEGLDEETLVNLKRYAHENLGAAYLGKDQYDQAFANLRSSSEILNEFSDKADQVLGRWPRRIRILSGVFSLTNLILPGSSLIGNIASSLTGADQLLTVTQAYYRTPSTIFNRLTAEEAQDQFNSAARQFKDALELAKDSGDREAEANAYLGLGQAYLTLQKYKKATQSFEKALEIFQELAQFPDLEAEALLGLGETEYFRGRYPDALLHAEQALEIFQTLSGRNREGEAKAYFLIGNIHTEMGEDAQALEATETAKTIFLNLEGSDRSNIADTQLTLSRIRLNRQEYDVAIDEAQNAFNLFGQLGDPVGEANSLLTLSEASLNLGQYDEALDYARKSVLFYEQAGDQAGGARALNAIGNALQGQRRLVQAAESFGLSLEIQNQVAPVESKSGTISPILEGVEWGISLLGSFFQGGDVARFIRGLQKKVSLARTFVNVSEGVTSNLGLGSVYLNQGEYEQARQAYRDMRDIADKQDNLDGEADALLGLSNAHLSFNRRIDDAQEDAEKALEIYREIGDRDGEAFALVALSQSYLKLAQQEEDPNKKIELYQFASGAALQALVLFQALESIGGEALGYGALGDIAQSEGRNELAVVFYKEAVNRVEAIRQNNQGLPLTLQQSYVSTFVGMYRQLAELLLSQRRVLEAQRVLELLKAEEIRAFTGSTRSYGLGDMAFPDLEKKIRIENDLLIRLGLDIAKCQVSEECQTSDEWVDLLNSLSAVITLYHEKVDPIAAEIKALTSGEGIELLQDPRQLGDSARKILEAEGAQPGTILIYPFVGDNQLYLLWTTAGGVSDVIPVNVDAQTLDTTVQTFRRQLGNRESLPQLQATGLKLYEWLIQPLEPQLQEIQKQAQDAGYEVPHLVFALDRVTRYAPMSALWDGNNYLVENYRISTIISAAQTDMSDRLLPKGSENAAGVNVLGLGVSEEFPEFPEFNALEHVPPELDFIVSQDNNALAENEAKLDLEDADSDGVYPGRVFLDDGFTLDSLIRYTGNHRILHIATHGKFAPNSQENSFLLMGSAERLSTDNIRNTLGRLLQDVYLVVLSACETALGGSDGIEIPGISSYFISEERASAVMASLWLVNDASTSLLMQDFYDNLSTDAKTKTEALRQAQLAFLRGDIPPELIDELRKRGLVGWGETSTTPEEIVADAPPDLDHPFFWAPFIIIGNGL